MDAAFPRTTSTLSTLVENDRLPFVRVLLAQNDTVLYDHAVRSPRHGSGGRLHQHDALWRIDSVTKVFTSFAAAVLVDRGLLDLDRPVQSYAPELGGMLPPHLTARGLATHTSGYGYPELLATSGLDRCQAWTVPCEQGGRPERVPTSCVPRKIAATRSGQGSTFPGDPGTEGRLYGPGHLVLAYIVERMTKQPLLLFLRRAFLLPAALPAGDLAGVHDASRASRVMPRCTPKSAGGCAMRAACPGVRMMRAGLSGPPTCAEPRESASRCCHGRDNCSYVRGDGGMLATPRALLAFARTLVADGVAPNGARLLSVAASRLLTATNQLPRGQLLPPELFTGALSTDPLAGTVDDRPVALSANGTHAFALGGCLTTGAKHAVLRDSPAARPGQFGWVGLHGVVLLIDRGMRLAMIVLTQLLDAFYMPELLTPCLGPPGRLLESLYADLSEQQR